MATASHLRPYRLEHLEGSVTGSPMEAVAMRLPQALITRLDTLAGQLSCTRSALTRELLRQSIESFPLD